MSKARLKFKFNNKYYEAGESLTGDVEEFAKARGYVETKTTKKSDAGRKA